MALDLMDNMLSLPGLDQDGFLFLDIFLRQFPSLLLWLTLCIWPQVTAEVWLSSLIGSCWLPEFGVRSSVDSNQESPLFFPPVVGQQS